MGFLRVVATFGSVLFLTAGCGGLLATPTEEAPAPAPPPTSTPGSGPKKPSSPQEPTEPPPTIPTVTKCTKERPADPAAPITAPPPAFFASHPLPLVANQGGEVLVSPRVIPIFFAGDDMAPDLENFVGSLGCTNYWRAAVGEYGVGDALAAPAVHLTESAPAQITDSGIEEWLTKKILAKELEPPRPGSVYTVFYPETTTINMQGTVSCELFGGYHTDFTLPDGTRVAYAAIPRCDGFAGLDVLDAVTGATSHELVEAATDPYNKEAPAYAMTDDDHLAFTYVIGGETGDMCAQEGDAFYKPSDYPYTVQRSWSNLRAKAGLSPCVPKSGVPYFTAAPLASDSVDLDGTKTIGVRVPAGTTKTIDVELYSDSASLDIGLDAFNYGPASSNSTGFPGGGTATAKLDRKLGRSGDVFKLTITAPTSSSTELVVLYASSNGRERIAWVLPVSQ